MSRKPAELEMVGGKSPRQRVWEQIRAARAAFTSADLAAKAHVPVSLANDYVKPLAIAGFIAVVSEERVSKICVRKTYQLVKDNGLEAPRVTKAGVLITEGSGNEKMWGTMRRMFKSGSFNYRELAAFSSTRSDLISEGTAKAYVLTLAAAGYLDCVQEGQNGKHAAPARYRLKPSMDSGSRAPMVQRTKQVFDPNLNNVIWVESKGIEDEQ